MRQTSACPAVADQLDDSGSRDRRHSILFAIGDCLFLMLVGAITTVAMHLTHGLNWNLAVTCLLGMLLAMAIQIPLAWLVAPVLGSIESMLPSMVLAMVSPMSVCAAHLMGCEMHWLSAAGLGTAFGVGMFVIIQTQSRVYRRTVYLAYQCR